MAALNPSNLESLQGEYGCHFQMSPTPSRDCSFTESFSRIPVSKEAAGSRDEVAFASFWSLPELSEIDTAEYSCSPDTPASEDRRSSATEEVDNALNTICSGMRASNLRTFNATILKKNRKGRVVNLPGRSRSISSISASARSAGGTSRGVTKARTRNSVDERRSWIIQEDATELFRSGSDASEISYYSFKTEVAADFFSLSN